MKLILDNIHKSYGDHHVLKGINLTVESGRAMGLLGRNGSGKTTMIRGIMDVFKYDEGTITLDAIPDEIGYLPEERGLYPKSSLIDQMVYFGMLKGIKRKEAVEKAKYWIDRMELNDYMDKKADNLSKGNQQKIQLAMALLHDPKVLILDEPFSGLDPVNSQLLKTIVREEIDKGKIVFFSSHQMAAVEEFCDDIAILNQGQITLTGDLRDIKAAYPKERIRFIGTDTDLLKNELESLDLFNEFKVKNDSVIARLNNPDNIVDQAKSLISKVENATGYIIVEPTLDEIFIEYGKEIK